MADARNGIKVPGWAVTAGGIALGVFLAGAKMGGDLRDIKEAQRSTNYRLCNIEKAVHISQAYTCVEVTGEQPTRVAAAVVAP